MMVIDIKFKYNFWLYILNTYVNFQLSVYVYNKLFLYKYVTIYCHIYNIPKQINMASMLYAMNVIF